MKKSIHPKYYAEAKITCACGNVIITGSTSEQLSTEICSACHPFYTGKKKIIDTAGRVERFQAKMKKKEEIKQAAKAKKAKLKVKVKTKVKAGASKVKPAKVAKAAKKSSIKSEKDNKKRQKNKNK